MAVQAPTVRAETAAISPFFIAADVSRSVAFYRDRLGFEVTFQEPAADPFFAIVVRDGAQLFLKDVGRETPPRPNPTRHPDARWDAYVYAPDPDALAADFVQRGAAFSRPLNDTHDGLRGFEVTDPDGYVLFFGRPR
jgi:catechol 2,3-dioxygenase-like lactoylglutathione lyase family enzyme